MAELMVGGAFLSATLQVLFDRLASRDVLNFIRGQKLNDALLRKLKITLLATSAVLDDAEEKQITKPQVKAWLDELKNAVYDAEDLLDEISTEALRCQLEAESQTSTDQVHNFSSSSRDSFDEAIKLKIEEILDRLEYIAKQKDVLGLKEVVGQLSQRLPTTSLVEEFGVFGRDDEKEEIIKLLYSDGASGNEICVITIVGMGGVGKTTLAQLVYNDDRVKDFDLKAWVCVSEKFDVVRVTKTILETITSMACDIIDLNFLQVKLMESLSRKRFLLVLDDVWNENYIDWNILRSPFRSAAKGSKIIVTTRSTNVALIMRTVPTHHLQQLSDKDCWSLFAKHAFDTGNSSAHPNLEIIGRNIVKKCKGLPLAAKTLGGLLRSKIDVKDWVKILESDIWDLPNDMGNILPALRLSYHYLPSHLKRCFALCSIFPKDYEFEKEQLILLWMAEDLLQQSKSKKRNIEELGDEYFGDLMSRSFFQRSRGNESCFVMHDLLNDLAKFVSGEFCFRLEGDNPLEISEKTRHLSYFIRKYDASKKFEAFTDAKCLRTFLPLNSFLRIRDHHLTNKVPHDLLPTLSCLRVLSLSYYINVSELPESIGSLKHLRYVDLSFTSIRKLPNSTITLYNLQTLILKKCRSLIELPANMDRLVHLRHLNVSETKLKEMPKRMSRLKNLRTLSTFVVGKQKGAMISELGALQHLQGALHILGMQNVVHAREAQEANLKGKKYLDKLVLEWVINTNDSQNESDVLKKLHPHKNLKELTIKNYGGTSFPVWLGDDSFCNMVYLCLDNCKLCFSLPPLGHLPCLKDLSIMGLDGVERVDRKFYGNVSSAIKPFRSLEILRFKEMGQWVEWFCLGDQGGEFPCLRGLYILCCPKLTGVLPGHLPSLTKLVIFNCQKLVASLPMAPAICKLELCHCDKVVLRSNEGEPSAQLYVPEISNVTSQPPLSNTFGLQRFTCLQELKLSSMLELKELPSGLHHLKIKDLAISCCDSLESFPVGGLPTTLKNLKVVGCGKLGLLLPESEEMMQNYYASLQRLDVWSSCDSLKSFPLGLLPKLKYLHLSNVKNLESLCIPDALPEDLTSLSWVYIWSCPKLVSFPKGGLPTPNLTILWVWDCENLKSMPERMHTLLPSLQYLDIRECPELESFPEGGLPSKLTTLRVHNCERLTARRMEWGLQRLPFLMYFHISGCEVVESFPEEWLLPSTLTSLSISSLPNLKNLDERGLQLLTSLQELVISKCPKLQCLPEEGLPISLSLLKINRCPLLQQRCQSKKGEDWPKIAHIPKIVINEELIS